jgi:putative spermidine/putrescine transport system ATP-binding protein
MTDKANRFTTLELKNLGRSFGGHRALSNLNLTVRAGEFIALLGPSGCGKSTALNCLAGLLPLTSGSIEIDQQRVDVLPSEKRDFGMVFQNYALFPHMTVRKNIAFGLEMRRVAKAEVAERVQRALALVKLEAHADKLPGQLSGGQQQRVAIARAIGLEPRLVLMDEPLSNLDAKLRLEMRAEIRKLHESLGLTTIYVTHDQEEALSMADRLVVLSDGYVQQIGTPEEVHQKPVNWYVADFMGYRNILDGTVVAVNADGTVAVSFGEVTLIGTAMNDVAVGDPVRIAIRPEDLRPASEGASEAANTLDVTITLVEYRGNDYSVESRLANGQVLHTYASTAPLSLEKARLVANPTRVLVYPSAFDPSETARSLTRELAHV